MKGKIAYTREYPWAYAPPVWRLLAKTAGIAFVIGVIVGAVWF